MTDKRMKRLIKALVVMAIAIAAAGCGPRLQVLSQQGGEVVIKTRDEPDYAYKYTVRVRNKGLAGKVRAIAELQSSEGQFYREQIIQFDHDEDKTLEFVFDEVSVIGGFLGGMAGNTDVKCRFRYESLL